MCDRVNTPTESNLEAQTRHNTHFNNTALLSAAIGLVQSEGIEHAKHIARHRLGLQNESDSVPDVEPSDVELMMGINYVATCIHNEDYMAMIGTVASEFRDGIDDFMQDVPSHQRDQVARGIDPQNVLQTAFQRAAAAEEEEHEATQQEHDEHGEQQHSPRDVTDVTEAHDDGEGETDDDGEGETDDDDGETTEEEEEFVPPSTLLAFEQRNINAQTGLCECRPCNAARLAWRTRRAFRYQSDMQRLIIESLVRTIDSEMLDVSGAQ